MILKGGAKEMGPLHPGAFREVGQRQVQGE